jgi:hypothetical protein
MTCGGTFEPGRDRRFEQASQMPAKARLVATVTNPLYDAGQHEQYRQHVTAQCRPTRMPDTILLHQLRQPAITQADTESRAEPPSAGPRPSHNSGQAGRSRRARPWTPTHGRRGL